MALSTTFEELPYAEVGITEKLPSLQSLNKNYKSARLSQQKLSSLRTSGDDAKSSHQTA